MITGVDDDGDRAAPRDHELLAALSGERPETVSPARYGPAVSPHLAAELAVATVSTAPSDIELVRLVAFDAETHALYLRFLRGDP